MFNVFSRKDISRAVPNYWDIAAGVLLVREAGGTVSDMEGGTLDLMRPRLLATNGKIHDEMTQKLAELLRSG